MTTGTKTKSEIFRDALENTVGVTATHIYQVAYYADDLEETTARLSIDTAWHKFRRTEKIRTYPGNKVDDAVFYVARHHDYMPGFEVELIQPLTDPNYISILGLLPGHVAHLGIKAEESFPDLSDYDILKRMTRSMGQAIQKGAVRQGRKVSELYTIYQIENFLPVKIVRSPGEDNNG